MPADPARLDELHAETTSSEWKGATGRGKYGVIGTVEPNGHRYAIAVFSAVPATHRKADTVWCVEAHEAWPTISQRLAALEKLLEMAPRRLACERIPEKVAMTNEEWRAAECHVCATCLFNEHLVELGVER